jgi:hypothetical protein
MLLNHQAMLPQGATVATDTRHGSAFVGVLARKPGRQHQGGWTLAGSVQVFLQVELLLGLGKTLREIIEIAGADQLTPGGVAAWRHCPVLIGEAATPDRPPRVLASQLIEAGVLVGPAPAGTHVERR